jgi:hypothetical protein
VYKSPQLVSRTTKGMKSGNSDGMIATRKSMIPKKKVAQISATTPAPTRDPTARSAVPRPVVVATS